MHVFYSILMFSFSAFSGFWDGKTPKKPEYLAKNLVFYSLLKFSLKLFRLFRVLGSRILMSWRCACLVAWPPGQARPILRYLGRPVLVPGPPQISPDLPRPWSSPDLPPSPEFSGETDALKLWKINGNLSK